MQAEIHGGQGDSLVLPYTRGSINLSRGPVRKNGASLYTRKRLSFSHGGQGESLVPPYTRGCVSFSHGGQGHIMVSP